MWFIADIPVPDRVHGLVVTGFLFTSLAFIVVGLRVFTRVQIVRKMGIDDCLIIVAMACSIVYLLAALGQITFGLGTPADDTDSIWHFLKAHYADIINYNVAAIVVKFSLLFQYRRLFETVRTRRLFKYLIIWLGTFSVVTLAFTIFTCVPVSRYWDDSLPGGCIDRQLLQYFVAGFNIVHDFVLLCFPMPFLRKLQIESRAKIVLMAIFACGAFACIVSIIRLRSLHDSNSAPITEQPMYGVDITMWSGLEINTAIICASVPSLKALFLKAIPKLSSRHSPKIHRHYTSSLSTTPDLTPLSPMLPPRTYTPIPLDTGALPSRADSRCSKLAIKVDRTVVLKRTLSDDASSERKRDSASAWAACYAGQMGSKVEMMGEGNMV